MGRPTDRCGRCCKEATWIRKTAPTMNRDEGATYYVTFGCRAWRAVQIQHSFIETEVETSMRVETY